MSTGYSTKQRLDLIEGLHRLAQFLDEHPDVPISPGAIVRAYSFIDEAVPEFGIGRLHDLGALLADYHDEITVEDSRHEGSVQHHATARFGGGVEYVAVYIERAARDVASAVTS